MCASLRSVLQPRLVWPPAQSERRNHELPGLLAVVHAPADLGWPRFALAASRHDGQPHEGGKLDDVTVVCVKVLQS